jgi:deoxycytidylate deaminase
MVAEALDAFGLELAVIASDRSTCAWRKVGAALRLPGGTYLFGHNWERNGLRCDEGGCPRGRKTLEEQPAYAPYDDCVAQHAEAMVLSQSLPFDLTGYTLYVSEQPCSDCSGIIGKFPGLRVVAREKGETGEGLH